MGTKVYLVCIQQVWLWQSTKKDENTHVFIGKGIAMFGALYTEETFMYSFKLFLYVTEPFTGEVNSYTYKDD